MRIHAQLTGEKTSFWLKERNKNKLSRFGRVDHKSIENLQLRLPLADTIEIIFEAFFILIGIPLLLGLDVLKKLRLIVNFDNGTLVSVYEDWRMKIVHKVEHLYVEWPPEFTIQNKS